MSFPSWEKALLDLLRRTGISMSLLSSKLGHGENRAVLQRKLRKTRAPCAAEEIRQINKAMTNLLRSAQVGLYLNAVAQAEGRVKPGLLRYAYTEWLDEALGFGDGYFKDDEAMDELSMRIVRHSSGALFDALFLAYTKRTIRWIDGTVPQQTRFDEVSEICADHGVDLTPYLVSADRLAELRKRDEFMRTVAASLAKAVAVKGESGEELFESVPVQHKIRFRARLEYDIILAYVGKRYFIERRRVLEIRAERRDAIDALDADDYAEQQERYFIERRRVLEMRTERRDAIDAEAEARINEDPARVITKRKGDR